MPKVAVPRLVKTLCENVTGTSTGAVVYFPRTNDKYCTVFCERTTGAGDITVAVQGRLTAASTWVSLLTIRQTNLANNLFTAYRLGKMPQMRASYIVANGTTVTTRLDG